MARTIKKKVYEKPTEDPLEELFEIQSGTTLVEYEERLPVDPSELVIGNEYDQKDKDIERQLQEVYNAAMDQFDIQTEEINNVEGRYRARMGEVAAQFLTTALNSIKTKADIKAHKDRLVLKSTGGGTTNNNLIVADRNDLLKALKGNT